MAKVRGFPGSKNIYSIADLKTCSPEQILFKNIPTYKGEVIGAETLCQAIKEDAFLLGVNDVRYDYRAGWWYIFSERDWCFLSDFEISSIEALFNNINYFPEKGRNACRLESYIWLLSQAVYTVTYAKFIKIKGENRPLESFVEKHMKNNYGRVIVFKDFKL